MILVNQQPEPASFDTRVRQPGLSYLAGLDPQEKVSFRYREYWRRVIDELHAAYNGICAYTCHYIPLDTGGDTVEHFLPKDQQPLLAYEWENFRLVCNRLNGRKGNYNDVIDPFAVELGMFVLDFPSMQVSHGPGLRAPLRKLARSTIARLKLNHERNVMARLRYVTEYCNGNISSAYLRRHAPFIGSELTRQGITKAALQVMTS